MKKRSRQHINPLAMEALLPRAPLTIPASPLVEVELGCADAKFLIERAQRQPDALFYGLDIRQRFLDQGIARVAELDLENVSLQTCNLLVDTESLFEAGRISRFFINFPDPWFKRRMYARRWLTQTAIGHLVKALKPGGEIFFQSDVWAVVLEVLGLLEGESDLLNANQPWSFFRQNPFDSQSDRECYCLAEGLPIWRLLYHRVSGCDEEHYD